MSLEIFYSERTGRKVLEETIQYEDTTFEIGLSVASRIEYGSTRLAYQYSFLQGERIESSFLVGLSTVDFEGGLTALGSIDDETGELVREEEEFLFPVPVFGLGLRYRPAPRVSLGGRVSYFRYKDSDEWDADILEFLAAAEYSVKPWFGLGLGYESVKMEYEDIDPDGFSIVYQYDGLLAYARFAF